MRPLAYTGEREYAKTKRTFAVHFANRGTMDELDDVDMRFNEEWFERLSLIPINTNISVRGQIIEIGRITLDLWNCELVD